MMDAVRTACPYCGVGCGLTVMRGDGGSVSVAGDGRHPANRGRICSKGLALPETLDLEGRLLHPIVDGREADWDTALAEAARRLSAVIRGHGPDAVAFYVSGQLLTEDYYVANKLMKGFIGSANIDTNSRLCMASSVAAHRRAFGEDIVPGNYEDLEQADLVVFVGSNAAWCHPVLYQRVQSPRPGGHPKIVVIDPRRTATCDGADLHLALAPGSEAILFNGLLADLEERGRIDAAFAAAHTEGMDEALAAARAGCPGREAVARACGLAEADVALFFDWFGTTAKTVTLYSQGVNQSSSGTDKVNAIINCHLATGRIGRPGAGPFSLTGQPNAMGGREVGGLANQLAAHMEIENERHRGLVRRFWRAPAIASRPGLKAVEMFRAIARGEVRAVWIMATNPAVSLPEADLVRAALQDCELVLVSDCVRRTDTAQCADILLPAAAWGEKDGTVTNSERRISRQRAFLPPPGEARPDWWIITQVARRLGFAEAFAYERPAEIFREHAALSGFENGGSRAFDISALAALDDAAYDRLSPIQWPVTKERPEGTERLLSDGRFFTDTGRARFIAVLPRPPAHAPEPGYPLVLNTGRLRDHWHTLTRTGKSPRLWARAGEPVAEIHPRDGAAAGIADGELVRVETRRGALIARARFTADQRPGSLFVPMHWSGQFAAHARVNAAVAAATDPVSGQPESKHMPARLAALSPCWQGLALSRRRLSIPAPTHWSCARAADCWRYELAGTEAPADWDAFAAELLGRAPSGEDWISYRDTAAASFRCARFAGPRLEALLLVSRRPLAVPRAWLAGLFAKPELSFAERMGALAGKPPADIRDPGEIVCCCFGTGTRDIAAAHASGRIRSADDIGRALKAGTSCGTCRPELNAVLRHLLAQPNTADTGANGDFPEHAV